VTDDVLVADASNPNEYLFDSIDLYIDAANTKGSAYQTGIGQYVFRWNGELEAAAGNPSLSGIVVASQTTASGYTAEFHFPWTTLGVAPTAGDLVGFEVMINDNDTPGSATRDGKIAWFGSVDQAWSNPSLFGSLRLGGSPNTAPVIETASLPAGVVAEEYTFTLAASGGDGALVWSIASGELPAGLALSADGVLSGTPTAAGGSTFVVRIVDSDDVLDSGDEDTRELSIDIAPGSAAVSLAGLAQIYDGTPRVVTVTTDPAGLDVT